MVKCTSQGFAFAKTVVKYNLYAVLLCNLNCPVRGIAINYDYPGIVTYLVDPGNGGAYAGLFIFGGQDY
jgi:hypothetical protein